MEITKIHLLIIALFTIITSIYLETYTSILHFIKSEAVATVESYKPITEKGDWLLEYKFKLEGEQVYKGSSIFAAKVRPNNNIQKIKIVYLPFAPKISEVKGTVTSTGLAGVLILLYIVILLKRSQKRALEEQKETT